MLGEYGGAIGNKGSKARRRDGVVKDLFEALTIT